MDISPPYYVLVRANDSRPLDSISQMASDSETHLRMWITIGKECYSYFVAYVTDFHIRQKLHVNKQEKSPGDKKNKPKHSKFPCNERYIFGDLGYIFGKSK